MTESLETLRGKILELVQTYAEKSATREPFMPGKSRVPYAGRVFGASELMCGTEAVLDFWLTAGRFAESFESRLSAWVGVKHLCLVNSGSSANLSAVSALTSPKLGARRLRPGDEVITVAAAFPTTVAPIVQNKLVPVFVDVDLGTYNAVPEQIEAAVGPRTRAVILAHTLGNPWNVDAIMDIAARHDLFVIEDNCDALGSEYRGKKTGGFGHLATLSFYPAHHITLGEGGAVLTDDDQLARIVRSFRDWGRDCHCPGGVNDSCGARFSQQHGTLPLGYDHKYVYSHIGYNLKATDIQAAIGCAQLDRLDGFTAARRQNFDRLIAGLNPFEDSLVLPKATEGANPSWFAFPLTVRPARGFSRAELTDFLEAAKIETRCLFSGNLLCHPAFAEIERRVPGSLPNTSVITDRTFFIGVYPGLGDAEVDYIIETFNAFMKQKG